MITEQIEREIGQNSEDFKRTEKGSMADRNRKLGPVGEGDRGRVAGKRRGRVKEGEGDGGKMGRVTGQGNRGRVAGRRCGRVKEGGWGRVTEGRSGG